VILVVAARAQGEEPGERSPPPTGTSACEAILEETKKALSRREPFFANGRVGLTPPDFCLVRIGGGIHASICMRLPGDPPVVGVQISSRPPIRSSFRLRWADGSRIECPVDGEPVHSQTSSMPKSSSHRRSDR